jgi:hypothetical protein
MLDEGEVLTIKFNLESIDILYSSNFITIGGCSLLSIRDGKD